jgi:hypothetical protein
MWTAVSTCAVFELQIPARRFAQSPRAQRYARFAQRASFSQPSPRGANAGFFLNLGEPIAKNIDNICGHRVLIKSVAYR